MVMQVAHGKLGAGDDKTFGSRDHKSLNFIDNGTQNLAPRQIVKIVKIASHSARKRPYKEQGTWSQKHRAVVSLF
jgi:hypothetical protein